MLESVNPRDIEASVNPDDISQIDGDVAGQLHESLAGSNGIIGCFNFCHRWIGHTKQHVPCVASCKNASAMLFVAAKVKHLNILPQGQPERRERTSSMLRAMQSEGFGNCTNEFECEAVCPKEISVSNISFLNREFIRSMVSRTGFKPLITQE